ncbi:MAG: ATP-binding protein [Actinomycetota bacterium]
MALAYSADAGSAVTTPEPLRSNYTRAAFSKLVSRESETVERKTGTGHHPIQEAIVAFSNTEGGAIFVGVRDDGTVVGRKHDQGVDDKIHEAALSARDTGRYRVTEIDVEGTPIVAIVVERRVERFAQTSDGRVLVRRGGRNVTLFGADPLQVHLRTRSAPL